MLRRALLILPLAAACTPMPPPESVSLPVAAEVQGAGDPTRGAILSASYAFATPARFADNPAALATALAQLEYLTVALQEGAWRDLDPLVVPMLRLGRAEARDAFGFRRDASAQVAVDALYTAAVALRIGNPVAAEAALLPLAPAGNTLPRFASLPPLPQAAAGTARARAALIQRDRRGRDERRMF